MAEADRRSRAVARRGRATLRKTRLRAPEGDLGALRGAEAVSLVEQLTRESWSLAGGPEPAYERRDIPCRFVPRRGR